SFATQAVALGAVRGDPAPLWRALIPPRKLLQLFLISLVVGVAAAVAIFMVTLAKKTPLVGVFVLVGLLAIAVYVVVIASQYALIILDDRAEGAEAVSLSADLTRGHRWEVALVVVVPLVLTGVVFSVAIPIAVRLGLSLAS